MDDAAKRVDVAGRTRWLAPDELRGKVVDRPRQLPRRGEHRVRLPSSEPEVGQQRSTAPVDEHVGRFDVAVDDSSTVYRV